MRRYIFAAVALVAAVGLWRGGHASGSDHPKKVVLAASLNGFNEVPPIFSGATGTLTLELDPGGKSITYELTYTSGFSSKVTVSHIHFAKVHVAGGVIIFLCSNIGGPAGTPACPAAPGKVTGTLTAAGIVGPAAQNISAGDFTGLLAALATDTAYANVHTENFPAGEIRGQIERLERRKNHDD